MHVESEGNQEIIDLLKTHVCVLFFCFFVF